MQAVPSSTVLWPGLPASVTDPVVLSLFPTFKFNLQFLPCQAGLPAGGVVNELEAWNVIRGPENGGLALLGDPEKQGSRAPEGQQRLLSP